jgi:hypothetical protein
MNALARDVFDTSNTITPSAKSISAEEIFRERCEARAILYEAAELGLHEAIDVLQDDAERTGFVDMFGQDTVQAMISAAFAKVPCAGELEDAIAELADALEAPRPRSGVAPSTLMAAEYLVHVNDPKRLRAWLARHTADECAAILRHIEEIAAHERNPTGGTHDYANTGRR